MHRTITIQQLDTGYFIQAEDREQSITSPNEIIKKVSEHGITSNDAMIAKVRELLGISYKKTVQSKPVPEHTEVYLKLLDTNINKSHFLVPEGVPLPNNKGVLFQETRDGRVLLTYKNGRVVTSFPEIKHLIDISDENKELEHVPTNLSSNQRTCIRQFMIAVKLGLKPCDSLTLDPDKDFRRMLNRSSMPEYERGTLERVEA